MFTAGEAPDAGQDGDDDDHLSEITAIMEFFRRDSPDGRPAAPPGAP